MSCGLCVVYRCGKDSFTDHLRSVTRKHSGALSPRMGEMRRDQPADVARVVLGVARQARGRLAEITRDHARLMPVGIALAKDECIWLHSDRRES